MPWTIWTACAPSGDRLRALLDSTILIDHLNGIEAARTEAARYDRPLISVVTWMEVLVGAVDEEETAKLERFLRRFEVAAIDEEIARRAVHLRRTHRLKLPDAIIWATAQVNGCLLVTRNTRDFPADDPGVRIPYALDR